MFQLTRLVSQLGTAMLEVEDFPAVVMDDCIMRRHVARARR